MIVVASRQPRASLLRLLIRLGWQRDPDLWTVRCRDQHGRRTRLIIALSTAGVTLTSTSSQSLELTVLEVGQLRAALRDALLTLDGLACREGIGIGTPAAGRERPTPAASPPRPRRRVRLGPPPRSSVAEVIPRLVPSPTPDQEATDERPDDHTHHPCLDT